MQCNNTRLRHTACDLKSDDIRCNNATYDNNKTTLPLQSDTMVDTIGE